MLATTPMRSADELTRVATDNRHSLGAATNPPRVIGSVNAAADSNLALTEKTLPTCRWRAAATATVSAVAPGKVVTVTTGVVHTPDDVLTGAEHGRMLTAVHEADPTVSWRRSGSAMFTAP